MYACVAEQGEDRREFATDHTGTDDDDAFREVVQREDAIAGEDRTFIYLDARQGARPTAGGDHHMIGVYAQGVIGSFNEQGVRIQEARIPAFVVEGSFAWSGCARCKQLHVAGVEVFPLEGGLVHRLAHFIPTEAEGFAAAGAHELVGAAHALRDLPKCLRGERPVVDAGAADAIALHQEHALAKVHPAHGGGVTRRPATDDAEIESFHAWL